MKKLTLNFVLIMLFLFLSIGAYCRVINNDFNEDYFHGFSFHFSGFHAGSFHVSGIHAGGFHAGGFHASGFHFSGIHAGSFHSSIHAGVSHSISASLGKSSLNSYKAMAKTKAKKPFFNKQKRHHKRMKFNNDLNFHLNGLHYNHYNSGADTTATHR